MVGGYVMAYTWYKKGHELLAEIKDTKVPEDILACWYIGQMGLAVKYLNTVLYIDPVLNDLTDLNGRSRRNYEIPFLPEEATPVQYVFCTHAHADHLNLNTLIPMHKVNPDLKFIVPVPEVKRLTGAGISRSAVLGASAGKELFLSDGIRVLPVAVAHEEYQTDENGEQYNLGYLVVCNRICLFHSGDCMVTEQLIETLCQVPKIHIACLPINGIDKTRRQRGIIGNIDCRDAAWLAEEIDADLTIPMHYDMVTGNGENPLHFAAYMQELHPGRKYHIMKLGERMWY